MLNETESLKFAFADTLKELMLENNLNNVTLSEALNCGNGLISQWLNAKNLPNLKSMFKLTEYFHVSMDYLLCRVVERGRTGIVVSDFARRLRSLCKENNITLYRLRENLGFSDQMIYCWLNGKYLPSTLSAYTIAEFFGCTFDYLCGRG